MTGKEISRLFRRFKELNILVVGDIMLDSYIWGKVDRISPEAPVPVVSVRKHENRLGGAANVALNLKALGASVTLAAIAGNDRYADILFDLLGKENLTTDGIFRIDRPTTIKTRVIGNNHQLLRIDEEEDDLLNPENAAELQKGIGSLMDTQQFDAVIFEDYDKGLISPALIDFITQKARALNIPVTADPKKRNFSAYRNVTLFKPNLKEISEGLKLDLDPREKASVSNAHLLLSEKLKHQISLITLSEAGIYIASGDEEHFLPAQVRTINDVSGAGDTVISIATLCLTAGADNKTIAWLSNLGGGSVCEKPGVVPVDAQQLEKEALDLLAGLTVNTSSE